MIAGVAFDLYRPLFTAGKLADLSGVKRPTIDTMATRGFIRASGREQPATSRRQSTTKGRRPPASKGRPLFSARDVFKVRLMRVLAAQLDLAFTESVEMAGWAGEPDKGQQKKIAEYETSISELADAPAYEGEWMWFLARTLERGKPAHIYAYATRSGGKWEFEMHIKGPGVEKPNEPPCFGWKVPHIYVPVSEIFIAVYNDCKKLLGITDQTMAGEDV
jgi:hypothetical protein